MKLSEELKSSKEWQELFPSTLVMDPDGWNRLNFEESWNEPITLYEYERRVSLSTVQIIGPSDTKKRVTKDESFLQECIDWLTPFGYSLHSRSSAYEACTFLHKDNNCSPAILCRNANGVKAVRLTSAGFKLSLTLTSGDIPFKHPDIKKYIDTMTYYEELALGNPPY